MKTFLVFKELQNYKTQINEKKIKSYVFLAMLKLV